MDSELDCGCLLSIWAPSSDHCVNSFVHSFFNILVGGFITLTDQYWVAYQVVIMFVVLLILVVCFLPETLYPRNTMIEKGAGALSAEKVDLSTIDLKRTRQLGFIVIYHFGRSDV